MRPTACDGAKTVNTDVQQFHGASQFGRQQSSPLPIYNFVNIREVLERLLTGLFMNYVSLPIVGRLSTYASLYVRFSEALICIHNHTRAVRRIKLSDFVNVYFPRRVAPRSPFNASARRV